MLEMSFLITEWTVLVLKADWSIQHSSCDKIPRIVITMIYITISIYTAHLPKVPTINLSLHVSEKHFIFFISNKTQHLL